MANKKKEATVQQIIQDWESLSLTAQIKAFEEIKVRMETKKKESEEATANLTAALN